MNIGDADFDFFIEFDIDYVEKQLLNFKGQAYVVVFDGRNNDAWKTYLCGGEI